MLPVVAWRQIHHGSQYMIELKELIVSFYNRGIIRFDLDHGLKLAAHRENPHAPRSPLYYDLRTTDNPRGGALTQEDVEAVAGHMLRKLRADSVPFSGLAPVPNAGVPLAIALQNAIYHDKGHESVPMLVFDKESGLLTKKRELERKAVLLVDDVISDGTSKERFIEGVRAAHYVLWHCVVFAKRSQKGEDFLKSLEVELHWVTTAEETLKILEDAQCISHDQHNAALSMLAAC